MWTSHCAHWMVHRRPTHHLVDVTVPLWCTGASLHLVDVHCAHGWCTGDSPHHRLTSLCTLDGAQETHRHFITSPSLPPLTIPFSCLASLNVITTKPKIIRNTPPNCPQLFACYSLFQIASFLNMNKSNDLVLSYLFITLHTFVFIAVNKKNVVLSADNIYLMYNWGNSSDKL